MTSSPTATSKPLATAITRVDLKASQEEDGPRKAPLRWPIIKRLWSYTTPHRRVRDPLFMCVILRGIQAPLLAWLVSYVLSGPLAERNWNGVLTGTAAFAALLTFTVVTMHFRMLLALNLGELVVQDLRRDIFGHLQRLGMGFYDRTKVGSIISRMTSDAEALRQGIQDVLFVSLVNVAHIAVAALVMAIYDLPLFLFVLAMSPIIWLLNRHFGRQIGQAW